MKNSTLGCYYWFYFSAYIGFCFNDKVKGIWQAGSGMALTNEEPFVPNCGAQVKASVMAQCDADGDTCRSCYEKHPCTECMYWPIYPCYSSKRPMVACIHEYTNDPISTFREDPDKYRLVLTPLFTMNQSKIDHSIMRHH